MTIATVNNTNNKFAPILDPELAFVAAAAALPVPVPVPVPVTPTDAAVVATPQAIFVISKILEKQ
jgi:hypothetical protein